MVQAVGRASEVRRQLPEAMIRLFTELEAKDLGGAWHKTKYTAGDEETAKAMKEVFMDSGLELGRVTGARNLGCDANDGRWRRTGEQDKMMAKAAKAAGRVQVLRAAGAATAGHLQRSSPTTTALWGAAVTGIADGKLHQIRIQAGKAEGRLPKGASVYLRLRASKEGGKRGP